MLRLMWQEVADVLEAVVLEKALQLRARYNSWLEVAKAIHAAAPSSWPKTLGDSAAFNVSLEIDPLNERLKAKFPTKGNRKHTVAAARKKALAILARSQVHLPDPDTTLWNYCLPKMHEIVNKGKLSSLQRSVAAARSRAGLSRRARRRRPRPPPRDADRDARAQCASWTAGGEARRQGWRRQGRRHPDVGQGGRARPRRQLRCAHAQGAHGLGDLSHRPARRGARPEGALHEGPHLGVDHRHGLGELLGDIKPSGRTAPSTPTRSCTSSTTRPRARRTRSAGMQSS